MAGSRLYYDCSTLEALQACVPALVKALGTRGRLTLGARIG